MTTPRIIGGAVAFALAMTAVPAALAADAAPTDTLTARQVFVDLPATTLDLLGRSTRLDMLDYFDVDSIYRAPNTMDGRSWLETVTPDYVKVVMTAVSTFEIKLLPLRKGGSVVMTVYTVGSDSQAGDSEVQFYDASLRPLDRDRYFRPAVLADFVSLPRKGGPGLKEMEELVPFPTVLYASAPGEPVLTGELTVGKYIDIDSAKELEKYMTGPVTYVWDGKQLRLDRQKK